ncbi:MAG: hypothetical protein ACKVQA_26260 [Burkholderiales bacterium]
MLKTFALFGSTSAFPLAGFLNGATLLQSMLSNSSTHLGFHIIRVLWSSKLATARWAHEPLGDNVLLLLAAAMPELRQHG